MTKMRIARLLTLCLAGLLVLGGVAVSAASAAGPEFKPAAGAFTATAGASKLTAGANTVTCTAGSAGGEITGAMTVGKAVVKFTGCKSTGSGGSSCTIKSTNAGAAGEIVTKELKGELGTVKTTEATSGVGLELKPAAGSTFTELEKNNCVAESAVTGSIAGEESPIGVSQKAGKLIFAPGTTGEKIKEVHLLGTTDEPELIAFSVSASLEASFTIAYAAATEIT
jgi:hypothetical protein